MAANDRPPTHGKLDYHQLIIDQLKIIQEETNKGCGLNTYSNVVNALADLLEVFLDEEYKTRMKNFLEVYQKNNLKDTETLSNSPPRYVANPVRARIDNRDYALYRFNYHELLSLIKRKKLLPELDGQHGR